VACAITIGDDRWPRHALLTLGFVHFDAGARVSTPAGQYPQTTTAPPLWADRRRDDQPLKDRALCHHDLMADDEMESERDFNERNIAEFRANDGKVGGQFEGFPLLILTSTGAKSGEQRENLIGYFDIDDTIYVVGSAAGRPASPGWVFNLRAQPHVQVEIGANPQRSAVARELPRDERDRVYDLIVERAPGFGEYQKKTDRVIPVFELADS
jgi:deazaflavin-dependent oxidoreductase (nitroreductase family)